MITSFLQGGLGNQMFQIAAAYSLSKVMGVEYAFNLNRCHTPAQGNTSNKYKDSIFKNVNDVDLNLNSFRRHLQPCFAYYNIPKLDNLMLEGDFQSEKFFLDYKDEIKKLFYFDKDKEIEIREYLSQFESATAIHVRRGDYLTKPNYHPTCSIEYYKKGMEIIGNESNFIFVSDDINWCKKNFKGKNIHYSPFTNELDDLYLIKLCNNQIIANSSFSWWGAYLCSYNNKVVAPSIWFGPNGPQDTNDVYNKNWIKI